MPAKTPIYLKTPTDKKGRRLKLRDILSGDMISPPLGDVRHSAHVGPQGPRDMFGDVAFLQGSMDMLPSMNAPLSEPKQSTEPLSPAPQAYSTISPPLWSTASLPLLMAPEQAPPKPPRLHLDTPPHHGLGRCAHMDPSPRHERTHYLHLDTSPQHGPAHYAHMSTPRQYEPVQYLHDQNVSLSHTIQRLVPSSGSSSDDSLFDSCGPLEVPRGLSLDSDAGLSNEDLRSEGSPTLSQSDSVLASLNLDLGPSIMEDVLSIMDRYKGPSISPSP